MILFMLSIISGYSIAIAAAIGLIRFKKIHKSYQPFIFICILGLLNEALSNFSAYLFHTNNVNYNVYSLLEAMLYIWLFQQWGHFSNKKRNYVFTIIFLCVIWIVDNLAWHRVTDANSLFWVIYSFTLVFLALNEINIIVMSRRTSLVKDSRFLICTGIVIFYTYAATISIFDLLQLNFSNTFYSYVYIVLQAVNFFINLVYALAILWAPKKLRFILHF